MLPGDGQGTPLFPDAFDLDSNRSRFAFDLDLRANAGCLRAADRVNFQKWLRLHRDDHVVLYHGTSDELPVGTKGLLPTTAARRNSYQSASGYVYLSYAASRAQTFAEMGRAQAQKLVVWAVVVPIRRLLPDHDQLNNKRYWGERTDVGATLTDSFAFGGGARIRGKIEPVHLVRFAETTDGRYGWQRLGVDVGKAPAEDWSWRCQPGWREEFQAKTPVQVVDMRTEDEGSAPTP